MGTKMLTEKMQKTINHLNLPLKVLWLPKEECVIHGEIKQGTLFIYSTDEKEALETFKHEIYEYKFKEITRLHMSIVNSLLEILQKEIYHKKEAFFDFLPHFHETMEELNKSSSH